MGRVISIFSRRKKVDSVEISENYNHLLQAVIESAKDSSNASDIVIVKDPEKFIQGKISSFLLERKMLDLDLLRCALYASRMIADKFNSVPESYYAMDYFLKGIEENDSGSILKGADFCFLLCAFFPKRATRRVMKASDYFIMGKQMYYSFYGMTQKTIGLSMGNNFRTMVGVVNEVII